LGEEGGWFANPSAIAHEAGRAAAQRVALARAQVAALIGAEPAQIVFTSGATEADNLAVLGTVRALAPARRHVISARTEHKAVLDAIRQLTREGASVTWLQPDADGRVSVRSVAAALRPDTALVSLMHVNNETGVIQDIAGIGAVCRAQRRCVSCRCGAERGATGAGSGAPAGGSAVAVGPQDPWAQGHWCAVRARARAGAADTR
jgi:cysteine desulfurase